MIVCYSNYINDVFKAVSNFQEEASELNEAINSFNFVESYSKILQEIQVLVDFINFLQSLPFDFNKSISKSLTILEKILTSNKSKDPEEVNHIINLLKKLIEKENILFDNYDKTQKKLIKIRTKLFNLFEKSKKKKICKVFNFISLACYHFFSFPKPTTAISTSIFKFLLYLLSFSINLRNMTADKPGKNIDIHKWSQTIIENIHSYSTLIKYYNEEDSESNKNNTDFDPEDKDKQLDNLKTVLAELNETIESGKGHGFDKLRSKLQQSKIEIIEILQIDFNSRETKNSAIVDAQTTDNDDNDKEEKPLNLCIDQSLVKKKGNISVYSSFYSDDLETKFTKSLSSRHLPSQFSMIPFSRGTSPLLSNDDQIGQLSSFNNELLSNPNISDGLELDSDLSISAFRSFDLCFHSKRGQRKKLTSSHSIFHLSAKNNSLSSSSFSFRFSSRKGIIIDDNSPIKIKPSGRHLTFLLPNEEDDFEQIQKNKIRPSISPYPENIDPELLIPFIPNPPFAGWIVSYLLKKVTFSTLPTINYTSTLPKFEIPFFNFHLPPIKQLIEESNSESDYTTDPELSKNKAKKSDTSKTTATAEANNDDDKKSKSKKKKKSLIHFRKKKKEAKQNKEEKSSFPKKKSWFKKSEMDKKSAAVIKQINISLRQCWKNLRNAKNKNDQFGRFQIVSEWYKIVYSYVPTLVNYSKDFPNNEFIVDAVREYERIRVEFDEILNEIEFTKGQTMVESIQQSAKQLSLILVALEIYINNETIQNKPKLSIASKIMGYLTSILCNLQIIVDCPDPSSFIACSNFIINIWKAIKEFYPVFSDLESYVKKSILTFAVDSILLTLQPAVVLLHEIDNNLDFSKNSSANEKGKRNENELLVSTEKFAFSNDQIQEQISHLKKVSDEFLNNIAIIFNKRLYVTMIADLFKEIINLPDFLNPLYITDLNELGNVVESTFIDMQNQTETNKQISNYSSFKEMVNGYKKEVLKTNEMKSCLTVLSSIRKLQFMLTVKLGNEFHDVISKSDDASNQSDDSSSKQSAHNASIDSDTSNAEEHHSITNNEFVHLVTQNESDFSELADLIQMNSVLYNSSSLQILTKNWFDSIFQITFAFVDLLKVAPILNKQPYLYSQVDSYYELLFEAIQFFQNTVKAKINVSSILEHLMANIRHTQNYAKTKPFSIMDENELEQERDEKESKNKKLAKKKKEADPSESSDHTSGGNKYLNSPLFERQFDLEKYKCGFFVNKVPIYKRAIFADYILSVITKLREPHQNPGKTMDYLTTFFIQVFTSLVNISQQLNKEDEKEQKEEKKQRQGEKQSDKERDRIENNKEYFLMLLVNRERDNILHLRYSEDCSFMHYGVTNKNKLIFLLSVGDLLAKYFELASMLSDDDQKIIETKKKNGRKRRKKKQSNGPNTRKRRGRVGEEFTIESLIDSDKTTDSDLEDSPNVNSNENDHDYSNDEHTPNASDNSKTESDNYSNNDAEYENSRRSHIVISREAKSKLKEMRHLCKISISHLKKLSKKLSKSIIQPFNSILRAKPATVKELFKCSESLATSILVCLNKVQQELNAEKDAERKIRKSSSTNDDDLDEDGEVQSNSIIIAKNESSCSLPENENDKKCMEIKESFDSIISTLQSLKDNQNTLNSKETKNSEEEDNDDDNNCTAGVYFEQIYADISNIPLILDCSYDKASRLFSKIVQKITKYAHKSLHVPYSELLATNLIDQFISLLKTTRNRYLKQYKLQESSKGSDDVKSEGNGGSNKDDDDENEQSLSVNFIVNERVNSQFETLLKTSKILLQRELIEKSNDADLLLLILSQKLIEQASNLHPTSEDYSFVLKTIMNLSIAVLNNYTEKRQTNSKNLDFESLKMFVASFDYFIENFAKEMDNKVLSDEMILVIHEFEKLPMHIPGYYAPKLCLRFLLIEADIDDDEYDD